MAMNIYLANDAKKGSWENFKPEVSAEFINEELQMLVYKKRHSAGVTRCQAASLEKIDG